MAPNPNACWDWNGWYGYDADQKSGKMILSHFSEKKNGTDCILFQVCK